MANNNSINGSFTTLSVSSIREVTTNTGEIVTAGGYINMNNDGILELHGKDFPAGTNIIVTGTDGMILFVEKV